MRSPRTSYRLWSIPFLFGLSLVAGCVGNRYAWRPAVSVAAVSHVSQSMPSSGIDLAEWHYSQAAALQAVGQSQCVDHFYDAAAAAWGELDRCPRAWELYHSAVTRLLVTAQRHQRWNPSQGLLLEGTNGFAAVPVSYHGFAWEPGDFDELAPVGSYEVPRLRRQFRSSGLGVPLVVVRRSLVKRGFLQDVQSFAATATLSPLDEHSAKPADCQAQTSPFQLELFNPLVSVRLPGPTRELSLARDLSAPFAYPPRGDDREWLSNFLRSGSDVADAGLFMLEPYQPGKIPVVFVHGLLSDPLTWVNMVNELRACPELTARYQILGFRYSTGTQFFRSAALLRRQLREIRDLYDPERTDPAFSRTVLVGHSMGGLLAKLQVVSSGDRIWKTVCNRPPAALVATPRTRRQLVEQLFFKPNPDIARVIFIATPHQGSTDATRCIGRLGASLIEESAERKQEHAQLVRSNPGFFKAEFERRIPRSIDLLEPANPLLQATLHLPFRAGVRTHSICGVVNRPCWSEPSDGVVSLESARLLGVCSEKFVDAKHTDLTHDLATIGEVRRILVLHARSSEF